MGMEFAAGNIINRVLTKLPINSTVMTERRQ